MVAVTYPAVEHTATSVFIAVLTRGPIPRNEIAQLLALSPATVSKAVRPMLEAGYLVESDGGESGASRPGRTAPNLT